MRGIVRAAVAGAGAVAAVAVRDLLQREHTVLRNYPVVGHARYLLEAIGPELRQYLVAGNEEERPFTRDQRRWVYASAKRENNYFGFAGTAATSNTPPATRSSSTGRSGPRSRPRTPRRRPTSRCRRRRCSAGRGAARTPSGRGRS